MHNFVVPVIVSAIEHKAVLELAQVLAGQGFAVDIAPAVIPGCDPMSINQTAADAP